MADRKQKFSVDAVGSDEYLTALTRRVEILEKKLVGSRGIKEDQPPLKPTLEVIKCLTINYTVDTPWNGLLVRHCVGGFSWASCRTLGILLELLNHVETVRV